MINMTTVVTQLRRGGWRVAIHNDYEQNGKLRTFWLWTHPKRGIFVKGEGETDEIALNTVLNEVERVSDGIKLCAHERCERGQVRNIDTGLVVACPICEGTGVSG